MTLLRILCLHGYTQNAISFTKKTAAFRRSVKDVADLVYVTAPHVVPIPTLSTPEEREDDELESLEPEALPYGWWTGQTHYKGFEESLTQLRDVLEKQGPFDGIMGFSQGASMASLLQLLLERPYLSNVMSGCHHAPFKFSILVSGFEPKDEEKLAWYKGKYPLLKEQNTASKDQDAQMDGDDDDDENKENALLKHYTHKKPVMIYHDGGHYMPAQAANRHAYKAFVQSFQKL
ncbi:Ovarian cancer-associated protein 2 [Gryganskiella cystojenkinii]|nr:Ovarian cancer-associated protein 2 [Gryganskiella cystojenkinii]